VNNVSKDLHGIAGALTTSAGTIIGWQSELEFWLRILSLCVGIVAGAFTIAHYAKKKS
jgi:hypothetical protein